MNITDNPVSQEQSFYEWWEGHLTDDDHSAESHARVVWNDRTDHYQALLAEQQSHAAGFIAHKTECITTLMTRVAELEAQNKRLDDFGREYIYFEENPHEYKLMSEQLAEKDAEIAELKKEQQELVYDCRDWRIKCDDMSAQSQWIPVSEVKEEGNYWMNEGGVSYVVYIWDAVGGMTINSIPINANLYFGHKFMGPLALPKPPTGKDND